MQLLLLLPIMQLPILAQQLRRNSNRHLELLRLKRDRLQERLQAQYQDLLLRVQQLLRPLKRRQGFLSTQS